MRVDSAQIHDALKQAQAAGLFDLHDPGIALFRACLAAGAPMTFEPGARVLEIGCCEAPWLYQAHKAWPQTFFTGIDTRAPDVIDGEGMVRRMPANVMDPELFEPESFDGIVSLSAIEHVGLTHYGDPPDPDGDSKAIANAWRWLKPGGWLYFDVPYDPSGYRVQGTECRVYDDTEIMARLILPFVDWGLEELKGVLAREWRGYVHAESPHLLLSEPPTVAVKPFHYCAMCWVKP